MLLIHRSIHSLHSRSIACCSHYPSFSLFSSLSTPFLLLALLICNCCFNSMKVLSLFLIKNSLGAKMKKGIRSFCNGDGSTSTLNQLKTDPNLSSMVTSSPISSLYMVDTIAERSPTLEEMILQLELEEEAAKKVKKLDDYGEYRRRMSCVNNSDILRSARNALNQYPRFSLDGRDAMYRSSFRNLTPVTTSSHKGGRKSVCCSSGHTGKLYKDGRNLDLGRGSLGLPPTFAGESVVWCKPGVVAKLMGLEAMPVPITGNYKKRWNSNNIRKENLKRVERREMEKRRHASTLDSL